jgi:hypothetical protein
MQSASADPQSRRRTVRLLASASFVVVAIIAPGTALPGSLTTTEPPPTAAEGLSAETSPAPDGGTRWRHGSAFLRLRSTSRGAWSFARGTIRVRSWRSDPQRWMPSKGRFVRWPQWFDAESGSRSQAPKKSGSSPLVSTPASRGGPSSTVENRSSLAARSPADHFGISVGGHLHNLGRAELERELDGYRSLGARWIRVDINWHVIQQSGPQSFNWAPFDNVVEGARARGINVLGLLVYTPPWARNGGGDPARPPDRAADYAAFAAHAVRHYAPMGVRHWEIWNEPNIPEFWSSGPDARAYTALLRAAYTAIKESDPAATVVSAGLSPYGAHGDVSGDGRINPLTFLERMYAAGAKGHVDAIGYHPYNFPGGLAFHAASAWSQLTETNPSVRSIMSANGDDEKQVWATEFGAPTRGGPGAITEEQQATLVADSYRAFGSYSWAGPLFWYSFRDLGVSGTDREFFFGLVRNDFSPKPAYAAFQQAASAVRR